MLPNFGFFPKASTTQQNTLLLVRIWMAVSDATTTRAIAHSYAPKAQEYDKRTKEAPGMARQLPSCKQDRVGAQVACPMNKI